MDIIHFAEETILESNITWSEMRQQTNQAGWKNQNKSKQNKTKQNKTKQKKTKQEKNNNNNNEMNPLSRGKYNALRFSEGQI